MSLNSLQRKIILVAILLFTASGLFPPWQHSRTHSSRGYALIFTPPDQQTIDFSRLLVEWIILAGVASSLVFLANGPRNENRDVRSNDRTAGEQKGLRTVTPFLAGLGAWASGRSKGVVRGLIPVLVVGLVVGVAALAVRIADWAAVNRLRNVELQEGMTYPEVISTLGNPSEAVARPKLTDFQIAQFRVEPGMVSQDRMEIFRYGTYSTDSGKRDYHLSLLFRNGRLFRWKKDGVLVK